MFRQRINQILFSLMHFLSADFIFDGQQFLPNNTVLCVQEDGLIVEIQTQTIHQEVQHYPGLLMPGFINAHCHLELSHLKNCIPQRTGLVDFLLGINRFRNNFSEEQKQIAIQDAEQMMLVNGIVAVGDISNGLDSLEQKKKGQLAYHTFAECVGLKEENAMERVEISKQISAAFALTHASSVVLHAPYSVSSAMMDLVNAESANKISSIHNQECDAENELFISGTGDFLKLFLAILNDTSFFKPTGKTSIASYLEKLNVVAQIILVHNTVTNSVDIDFANTLDKKLFWCVCPNANLYIENKLPNIPLMMEKGCKIVLGTDSLASNHSLDILAEIKTIQKYFPSIELEKILSWATIHAAQALGMENEIGSFTIGKKPGIIQIEKFTTGQPFAEEATVKRIY